MDLEQMIVTIVSLVCVVGYLGIVLYSLWREEWRLWAREDVSRYYVFMQWVGFGKYVRKDRIRARRK